MCDYSVYNWFKYYYVPLSFQGLMLVILTFLQHQNEHIEVGEGRPSPDVECCDCLRKNALFEVGQNAETVRS